MDMQAVLKAGGVGAGVLILLSLLGYIPCLGCLTLPLVLIAYVGIGVLAANWMLPPLTVQAGAINGAVAAIVAAFINGIVSGIISAIYFSITGTSGLAQGFQDMPPEQLEMLRELGFDPSMLAGGAGVVGVLAFAAVCCVLWLVVAALLGAGGGAFWANNRASKI